MTQSSVHGSTHIAQITTTQAYTRQKTRSFRLSSRGQNPTTFSCRVLASQKNTSLLEVSMALSSSARGAELPRPQTDALAPVARSCASKRYSILPEVSQTGRETDRVPHLDVWTLVCCTRAIDRLKYLSLHRMLGFARLNTAFRVNHQPALPGAFDVERSE
ncbi:hypothetical protein EV363DRAFT_755690 [Boletus edulis]|nr:hypothetical protein EV363DRAFT_755690 [Boletus edulis]